MDDRPHTPRLNFSGIVPSGILQTILVDIVFPYMLYQFLVSHISLPLAFALAAIIPLANIVWTRVTLHILDLVGIISLYIILWIFMSTFLLSNLAASTLLSYILPIGILGVVTLCTRLLARPLFFYVDRYFRIRSSEQPTLYDDSWGVSEHYRKTIYHLNLVWGGGQIVLALAFLPLFIVVPVGYSSLCALIITCLFYIILTMWSIHYIDEHSKHELQAKVHDTHSSSSPSSRQDYQ